MKNAIISILLSYIIIGCSSTNYLTLSVLEPAPVTLPSYIKKVGIIDRSLPSEETKQQDKIDQILSVEGENLDAEGARETIRGLNDELQRNERFTEIQFLEKADLRSPGMGIFPAPLSWNKIDNICTNNGLDALFVLEYFDTDTKISYSNKPVTLKGPMGIDVPAVEHYAHMITFVNTGWRIYDPQSKNILDEFTISDSFEKSGKGINPAAAAASLMGRKETVKQAGYNLGLAYADRILPYKIRVSRKYYVRGSDNFKIAKRRAQTGNWDGAAELWEKETQNTKRKVAGRAYYNMAIINEINGNLEDAVRWSQQAYTDYKIKLALEYLNILEGRIARNAELQQQLEE